MPPAATIMRPLLWRRMPLSTSTNTFLHRPVYVSLVKSDKNGHLHIWSRWIDQRRCAAFQLSNYAEWNPRAED